MTQQYNTLDLPQPVVILGGGGFIGSALGEYLSQMGYFVKLVDVEFHDWRWSPPSLRYLFDLRDPIQCQLAIEGAGTVFHLAADMGGVEYFHSDADFGASIDNQLITTNVIKACVQEGVQRLVYASSACAADTTMQFTEGKPHYIVENDIQHGEPDARYGAEKRHGAYMVANAPLDGRVGVFHTIYGPGQEYEGVRKKFPSAVATGAIKSLETGNLTLFGNGKQLRTYLYIDDAVRRIYTLAMADRRVIDTAPFGQPGIFNIGAETVVSCKSVAETCLRLVSSDATITYNPGKPSGVLARACDNTKWKHTFGVPHETSIEAGFFKFIDWLRTV